MNPPVFAALSVYIYSLLSSVPFIMDTHTPSLYGRRWGWTLPLQRFLAKKAFVNIIDQERFGRLFDEWGAPSVILERPPLDIGSRLGATYSDASNQKNATFASHFHIAVVSTFSSDEPLDVVIQGAARLPDVTFSILGDTDKAPKKLIQNSPSNVHYPGYLMGSAYWEHLQSADAIMVLTTFSHSLLGGAQEGLALGKPLILSGQPALTNYFTQGALFIEHDGESIVDAVIKCRENYTRLCAESSALSVIKRQTWHDTFRTLELTLLDAVKPRK
ncbi:MAG: glycosyltransferase [Chloroflexota bacterium]